MSAVLPSTGLPPSAQPGLLRSSASLTTALFEPEDVWSDVWEHARLLGDVRRTHGLVDFLARHAPGRSVVEIGCGTGLLSCIAARMGARWVVGIEPTERCGDAAWMARESGLADAVTILRGRVEDLPPQPAELVFSELLNADPFVEGVLSAMHRAEAWCLPCGRIAPHRLDIHCALVAAADIEVEMLGAVKMVRELGQRYDLRVDGLLQRFEATPPSRTVVAYAEPCSQPVRVASLPLGTRALPPASQIIELQADAKAAIWGVATWFSASYDDELVLSNPPESPGHWGVQVNGWTRPIRVAKGQRVRVLVEMDEDRGVTVSPA